MRCFHWTWKGSTNPLQLVEHLIHTAKLNGEQKTLNESRQRIQGTSRQFFERKTNIVTRTENEEDKKTQGGLILGPTL